MQDIPWSFPSHPWLDTLEGHESLQRVFVGYSLSDSQVGYFQVRLVFNISSNFIFCFQLCYAGFLSNWKTLISCALIMTQLCILAARYVDQMKIIVHKTWLKLCGCIVIACHENWGGFILDVGCSLGECFGQWFLYTQLVWMSSCWTNGI